MESKVCITGIGVISPIGIGRTHFYNSIIQGKSGLGELESTLLSDFNGNMAGHIKEFQLSQYLKTKGLRYYNRTMGFAEAAAGLALLDAEFNINDDNENMCGVFLGTTYGNIESLRDFYQGALVDGARYVNPMMYPRTMMTVPASQVCINHHVKGINRTFSNGEVSGMDAICYAAEKIVDGDYSMIIAGGAEELNTAVLAKQSYLSENVENVCPGEGAAVVILENTADAIARNQDIYAKVEGYAQLFNCYGDTEDAIYDTVRLCMKKALDDARIQPQEIDAVLMQSVPGSRAYQAEAKALDSIFGLNNQLTLYSIQELTGDCLGASSAMQICAGACLLHENCSVKNILCNAFMNDASYTTVILKGMD